MNTVEHNSRAWNKKVENGVVYTKPVNEDSIEKAKANDWKITVTTERAVPRAWFPSSLKGVKILCLASGGGQQGPILAAAGAEVTVVDISKKQLEQDQFVAERDGLHLKTIQGSMSDLHFFDDESFDLIVHPVSNVFVENISPVWKEASRVLKEGGVLISGFTNPLLYIFDDKQEDEGFLEVKHSIPFSSMSNLNEEELQQPIQDIQAFEFGHTLEDQIQGQIDAGFLIAGLYEDDFGGSRLLDNYIKTFIATRAIKVSRPR
ncbi:class I SAM-dependent methyltransferase [Halobacillus amylolyticus]|uniref:Class I SAM-dependent methyltransferase n=1 Tax=Halobacillus amylolyticus TaxID=2932259 RepID=A0ABY4HD78_9BACI|nr:class I SAM-dependent methyltransferase [Halobacillus amylolyticus]UOR12574.1 class I SAM-dependent methyltransferase [Halobacillus amylolyticus]